MITIIIFIFIIFLVIFLLFVEFFTLLFVKTGLSYEKSRFQVVSLLTSVGYTTKESEYIVQNEQRRKIASWVMILGYVSNLTFISFLINILSKYMLDKRLIILIIAVFVMILCIKNRKITHFIDSILDKIINKKIFVCFYSKYKTLMEGKNYAIYTIRLNNKNFLIEKNLIESNLKDLYNIQVLMIKNGQRQINCPDSNYIFKIDDEITIYGEIKTIEKLFLK